MFQRRPSKKEKARAVAKLIPKPFSELPNMVKVIPSVPPSQTTFKSERELVDAVFATGTGGAELTPQPDSVGLRGDLSPHPCLTGNNSINVDIEEDKYLTELRKKSFEHYKEKVLPLLSGYHKKKTYALQKTIEQA